MCEVEVATKEYHTSLAVVIPKPQLAVGAKLCVEPNTVPVVGVVQVAATVRATAVVHSSFVAGVGSVVKVKITGGDVVLPAQLLTRLMV